MTSKQKNYIASLAKQAGYYHMAVACKEVLGKSNPRDSKQASEVIDFLLAKVNS